MADTAWLTAGLLGASDEKPKKKKKDSKDGSRAGSTAGDGQTNSVNPIREFVLRARNHSLILHRNFSKTSRTITAVYFSPSSP